MKITDSRNVLDGERRYIDTGEHWKGLYEKLLDENKALSDSVHRERQLRLCQHQERSTDNGFPQGWNEESTFMSANDEHQLRMSSYGEQATATTPSPCLLFTFSPILCCPFKLTLSFKVVRLGRERGDLDKINELLSDPNHIEDALKQVTRLLALLENALLDCCPPLGTYRPRKPWQDSRSFTNLRQVTYQVKLGFMSCFTTLNGICGTIPGRKLKKGFVIYGMVSFMTRAIKLLHTLCKEQTEHRKSREDPGDEQEVYAVNKCLTCTIVSIILGLDFEVGKPGHAELLEGILFTILEHTGSLLSVAIFGDDMPVKKKRGCKDKNKTPTIDTTNAESLYMVQILYAALGGAEKQKLVSRVLMAGDGAELIEKAKRFIQGTLLKSTYGKEHIESLRLPVLPEEEVEVPEVEYDGEIHGQDWLINMATSIVGWDLVLPE